jgi:hypothetical protein
MRKHTVQNQSMVYSMLYVIGAQTELLTLGLGFSPSGDKHSSFLPNMLLRAIYKFQYIITTHQIPSY